MSKEEAERTNAQVRTSSLPPRNGASEPPRALPSTPPETDDIDTDWGVEQPAAAPTQIAAEPISAAFDPAAMPSVTDTPPTVPSAEDPRPVSKRAAAPPPAAPPLVPGVRPNRLRSHTLLGMPEPKLSATPQAEAPSAEAAAAPLPTTASASATPVSSAPNETRLRKSPLLSRTLIGMAEPLPPPPAQQEEPPAQQEEPPAQQEEPPTQQEEPRAALATPVPEEQTAARVRSSVPPPIVPPPPAPTPPLSTPEPARGQAALLQPTAPASPPKAAGRVIVWLAAAGLALGVLGYLAAHRLPPHPVSAEVQAAIPAAPAASELAPLSAPTPEPTAASPAASAAPSAASAAPSAASAAPSAASVAPSAASGSSSAPGMITITVKSVPPKARVFHFGKQVGITPWVVELKPGEHHAYEVGFPGRVTRKLVLDGSKTEITVGLKAAP